MSEFRKVDFMVGKSESNRGEYGILYVVGTPIGNLKDMTFRAIEILKDVDIVLAEDTRRTKTLLQHFGIEKYIESFNEHNSYRKIEKIIEIIKSGKRVAQVSDAGMPVISDPGYNLVRRCHEEGIKVEVIPGPSALTSAVAVSGFRGTHFYFIGFMPKDKNRRRLLRKLEQARNVGLIESFVFFESPERLLKTLEDVKSILGSCEVFIARELTKFYEEHYFGTIEEALEKFKNVKGELTVIVRLEQNEVNEESKENDDGDK